MVVNLFLCGPWVRMWHTNQARFINRVEVAGIYWRFVDLVWIFIFPVLPAVTHTAEAMVRARSYLVVFGALLALTVLTVGAASMDLPTLPTVVIGLAITLAFTAVSCAALFGLTIWTEADHVPGTQLRTPFF